MSYRCLRGAALSLLTSAGFQAWAQSPPSIDPPVYQVGDSWTWDVTVNPRDKCTDGISTGAQEIHVVTATTDQGYIVDVAGPQAGSRTERIYQKDLSYETSLNDKSVKTKLVTFPLGAGGPWDTTLVNKSSGVVTTLTCESGRAELVKVGMQEFDTTPITCKGKWQNLSSGNNDTATYKYWYSSAVGNFVRRTVFTYFRGGACADIEYRLAAYKHAG